MAVRINLKKKIQRKKEAESCKPVGRTELNL